MYFQEKGKKIRFPAFSSTQKTHGIIENYLWSSRSGRCAVHKVQFA